MKIHISSLDYDGCLFTKTTMPKSMEDYITNNPLLLERISTTSAKFDKRTILVGSNRQSTDMDASNGYRGTGSCYLAIDYMSKHLGIEFDKFLLSDIYLEKTSGFTIETFLHVVNTLNWQNIIFGFSEFARLNNAEFLKLNGHDDLITVNSSAAGKFFSDDKINLIYAQMHKIASEHPEDEIVFDFYDDRLDILTTLFNFFEKYPVLIPRNITLKGFQYEAGTKAPEQHSEIQGTGNIDAMYSETVLNMGKIALREDPSALRSGRAYTMSEYITPEGLEAQIETTVRPFSFFNTAPASGTTNSLTQSAIHLIHT